MVEVKLFQPELSKRVRNFFPVLVEKILFLAKIFRKIKTTFETPSQEIKFQQK